ncbi:oxidoreductase [Brevirhabdus pacifica]|uniref:Oxidoreductase n=1 Tax=Brevirhabdus pacifica TaxID=1267768 RepID=A0A1U7DMH1_9RHOB|nr:proton-conducting transporter membrane subunit [Brevirhabdus pacifica]APX91093.1 oxidoreductase [Brevirhabdus pacifica]OWU75438.1 oxidoreductase [Loktanella sp. 22II-4b]PJJ82765.1 NADH-quinone oxidoreductase subunit L [Brevirhabdus pacifica]
MTLLLPSVVALPLISAVLTFFLSARMGRKVSEISVALIALSFALTTLEFWSAIRGWEGRAEIVLGGWLTLFRDPLSAILAWVIAGFSLIVHVYSRRYMADEPGYARFFILLNLMTAALLVMVSASNLILLLIAWHFVGVLLYLLLGQDLHSRPAQRHAFTTFFTYRLGDLPMVLAAALLFHAYGTWSLTEIFARLGDTPQTTAFGLPLPVVVGFLIALSAFARSAQFLVHTWLPYTMNGPTPVSALMHAGIVNAGGVLVNRFAPVYVHAGEILHLMFVVGLFTAIVGSVLMLTQHDIKKSLGYSTMGQMGFMIMECGVGAFSLAIYHLIAHGMFKGTMFLNAAGVIRSARRDDGVPAEDLYTFIVERQVARRRRPWLAMAIFTLTVPAVILFLAHYFVEQAFMEKQGAVILLFFGWMTGAQLIFATYHMRAENPLRLFSLILVSFTIVVIGYSAIAHTFDLYLYPDEAFRKALYTAAGVKLIYFDVFVALLAAVIVLGWIFTYYSERKRLPAPVWSRRLRGMFYATVSREFFLGDVYARTARAVIGGAGRINAMLGWR